MITFIFEHYNGNKTVETNLKTFILQSSEEKSFRCNLNLLRKKLSHLTQNSNWHIDSFMLKPTDKLFVYKFPSIFSSTLPKDN